MQRFRHRLHVWIAIFAMALSALAPEQICAMGPDDNGRYLVQICSAVGMEWVELSVDEAAFHGDVGAMNADSDSHPSSLPLEECPYCLAQFGNVLAPAADLSPSFAVAGGTPLPTLFLVAPRPLFAWSSAHPRAPPARA